VGLDGLLGRLIGDDIVNLLILLVVLFVAIDEHVRAGKLYVANRGNQVSLGIHQVRKQRNKVKSRATYIIHVVSILV
jgi:hypothetical protein